MDLRLSAEDRELQRRAREFTEKYLFPHELETEEAHGKISDESRATIRAAVLEYELNAINHSKEDGGQGLTTFQQMLVEEELGKATNCLWALVWHPSNVLAFGSEQQKDEYLRPACRGEREDCYAITEEGAGSDPSMVQTTARKDGNGWIISGTKWHVTAGDRSDIILVHAHVDGDPEKATVFIVDKDLPGIELVRTPKYTHTSYFEHPIYSFDDVRVGDDKVLGDVGQGYDLTKDWFVEERLMIGARTVGASQRALDLSLAFAKERVQFGEPIIDFQSIEFMLADMAAEIMAAKALLYRVGWESSQPDIPRKQIHAMASAVKLICSETANRVADKAVQIFGGRGYMREQPVERLWRELRVDRLWEGTSEIQRLVIGNELRKRGPGVYTDWPA
ncbi:MAG: acyl-CoA dehydrogenase family protein [Actinomycetota bacterium]